MGTVPLATSHRPISASKAYVPPFAIIGQRPGLNAEQSPRLLAAQQRLDVIDKKSARHSCRYAQICLKAWRRPPSARLHAVGLRADHPAHTARSTGIDLWRVGVRDWRVGA